jgi:pilus assembly protein CpaE
VPDANLLTNIPASGQYGRERFIGFARDEATATMLREVFAPHLPETSHIQVADFHGSLARLHSMATPEIVLVDLSGEGQPLNAVAELANAVEAGTVVLAIGEVQSLNVYRSITKGLGIKEYLPKPLTRANIQANFLPVIGGVKQEVPTPRGGRMVTVTGTRGGVGTSTIAANLAWFIGAGLHRHTVLVDSELHTGTAALNFNLKADTGLGAALESPERVDQFLIERATQPAGERLHVLAGQELLERQVDYKPDSAAMLIQALRSRYNFVVSDAGAKLSPFARDLLSHAQQRVIIMDPSMISIRNLERLLRLPDGPSPPGVVIVLNKAGTPGGLSQVYMERVMGLRFGAVIPDLPRIVPKTTQFGTQAASLRGPFRNAIIALANALGSTAMAEAI